MSIKRDFGVGFFDDVSTQDLITSLANAKIVTLFVGAGASTDQGMPTWSQLVSQLLAWKLPTGHSTNPDVESQVVLAPSVLTSMYQEMATASIVDSLYELGGDGPAERNEDIRKLLYLESGGHSWSPVYLATYITYMCITLKQLDVDVQIATTNYDDSLETMFANDSGFGTWLEDIGIKFETFTSLPTNSLPNVIPVIHLHGSVPRSGLSEDVVFSERDYVLADREGRLRNYFQDRVAAGGFIVAVGSSLRDQDLVAALVAQSNSTHSTRVVALLPIQNELDQLAPDVVDQFSIDLRNLPAVRGNQLGVDIYRPDFYGQVYQFLHEVTLAATYSDQYVPYSTRLRDWWTGWESTKYDNEEYRRSVTLGLQRLASDHATTMSDRSKFVKIEVWSRSDPDARVFELWCSSQSMWLDRAAHRPHEAKIGVGSPYAAVNCFALRVKFRGRVESRSDGRWSHFVAVPINLKESPYNDLPVGVVIALFDLEQEEFADDAETTIRLSRMETHMLSVGEEVLTPGTGLASETELISSLVDSLLGSD